MLVLIRGAGDLATGIAWRLWQAHFDIVMTDLPRPTAIRRTVAFSTALEKIETTVEGVTAVACATPNQVLEAIGRRRVAVLPDPSCKLALQLRPDVLVDAILAKRNLGTRIDDAPLVIGVGPGFCDGRDCHYVIETQRGHDLGRVIEAGPAAPNSGIPGNIGGYTSERILRAPAAGVFRPLAAIGDLVQAGQTVAEVDGIALTTPIAGMVRGMLAEGVEVTPGFKCGDVDPRGEAASCTTISDKARAIGGGVLEAILRRYGGKL